MANNAVLGGLVVLVAGGIAGWYFLPDGGNGGLGPAGTQLLTRFEQERNRDTIDRAACRKLLANILVHPERGADRGLTRAEAWLHLQLGNSAKAWDALQSALDVDAEAPDMLLAAQILKSRHAETGLADPAERGTIWAEDHYRATRAVRSLFLGWQLAARLGDAERTEKFVDLLAEYPDSPEHRLAVVLAGFPDVGETAADLANYRALLEDFDPPPEELQLAIAWCEVGSANDILTGLKRAEEVMRTYRSSVTARTLVAVAALRLEQWERARKNLDDLLKNHPQHRRAEVWRKLRTTAEAGAAKAKK